MIPQRNHSRDRCGAYEKMTNLIKISFLILMFLTLFSCQNSEQKPVKKTEMDFGLLEDENDSIAVELKLNEFKSWKKLLERTEQISCSDSLPKITIENDSLIKRVYLRNFCWEGVGCILIRQRNIIEIHNDTVNKSDENFYPLDSLPGVLKRDLENNGKNPKLSDNPEKLLVYISYDKNGLEKLPNTLNQLTKSFKQITDRKDLKILLNEKFFIPPPPNESIEIEFND